MIRVITIIVSLWLAVSAAQGALTPDRTGQWTSTVVGKALATELFVPQGKAPRQARPGIIYLKNLNHPRIGQEEDAAIIADLLKDGFMVLTVDYAKDPKAVAPQILPDLRLMRGHLRGGRGYDALFAPYRVDDANCRIMPAGHRLARNIQFYGEEGKGFCMDVCYPSKPLRPVPAVVQVSSDNVNRNGNDAQWINNDLLAEGFLTRGYAGVWIDNPMSKRRYVGYDRMPDVAVIIKAAVRAVRAGAAGYNIDADHIGLTGFSQAASQAALAAMSGGMRELEQGPNLNVSSRVQAVLLNAGTVDYPALLKDRPKAGEFYAGFLGDPKANRSVWEQHSALYYVTADDPPTFLSVGARDYIHLPQAELMAAALKKAGVECKQAVTPNLGLQVTAAPEVLSDIYQFFDAHLAPSGIADNDPDENQQPPTATP
ncbi:MAG: prolyl oligopeptidase family serine peptidase [Planctomycetaceae bacterium]|nr:prolyl oligopeptidase family serine peptidase [Planctomycetaceae bacterium]